MSSKYKEIYMYISINVCIYIYIICTLYHCDHVKQIILGNMVLSDGGRKGDDREEGKEDMEIERGRR